jgi:hypothetical protein
VCEIIVAFYQKLLGLLEQRFDSGFEDNFHGSSCRSRFSGLCLFGSSATHGGQEMIADDLQYNFVNLSRGDPG